MTLSGGFALAQSSDAAPAAAPQAQTQGHPHVANPHREAMRMSKRLNLSDDQTAKLEPILADRDQKIAAVRSNTALSPEEVKAQMREIHKGMRQQLESVLTPEQMQQLKTMRRGRGALTQPDAPAGPAGL
jgi:Spy/CpxP family protein refolding chaperone